MAEAFHVLPSQVARALDNDPDQVDLLALECLTYAKVKAQFDDSGTDDKALEHLKDHPHLAMVRRNTYDLRLERRRAALEAQAAKERAGQ